MKKTNKSKAKAKTDKVAESVEIFVKDKSGRVVLKMIKDRMMVMRVPDMDEYTKKELIYLYTEFTSEDPQKLRDFLDFKSEDNEFCS